MYPAAFDYSAPETVDEAQRQQLWNEAQQMAHEDAGWLFLWQQHDVYGVAEHVDWQPRADEFMWMGDARPRNA
jgi:peptide/nickel transport system substrate-binding protein